MILFQALFLGLVQGVTEFIPISSSAHLIIVPWLFGWEDPVIESLPFDVALHLGTLLAVLAFFARDWIRLIRAGFASLIERKIGNDVDRRLAWLLVIGVIPGAIAGVLGERAVEEWFHPTNGPIHPATMIVMGLIIAILGALLWLAERLAKHERGMNQLSLRDSIYIGCAQALAIFPGVSRSGSTITAGLALGLERETAARFSFLLSAPIILGAGLKSAFSGLKQLQGDPNAATYSLVYLIGFVAAAISGYLCIRFLLRYLQNHATDVFVYYRWALAALVIIVALVRG